MSIENSTDNSSTQQSVLFHLEMRRWDNQEVTTTVFSAFDNDKLPQSAQHVANCHRCDVVEFKKASLH